MLNAKLFANAVTIVWVTAYLLCGIAALIAPDQYWSMAGSWLHAINLEPIKATTPMSAGTFIFGVISFAIFVWIVTFASAKLYNRFSKSE